MIDLIKLQAFIFAAENKSFSAAAKQLHLTQPTISHHIKSLEKKFGVTIFHRTGQKIHLTEAGRLLLPQARKLVRQSIELEEMMLSADERIVGLIRIACSTTAGKYILPQLAARFHQRFPGIQVSILACKPEYTVPQLLEEEADLAVVSSEKICSGIESQPFFKDYVQLILPSSHPWALRPSIEPADLLEEQIIIREPSSGTRRVLVEELAKHDISLDECNIFLELGNAEAIISTVAAGFGISFVSRIAARCHLELGCIANVPVENLELERTIYMIRKKMRANHLAQEVFWGFVHDPANSDLICLANLV